LKDAPFDLSPCNGAKSKGAFFKGLRGFTLVELLVAMVLLSMVTLVVAMALKLSIESWERGVEEGENIQRWVAIPSLMEKQLGSLVKADPFDNREGKQLPFCGNKHAFSFFTSYAPQGSPWQGLLRISYLFKEEEKALYLFEQVITRKEDLDAEFDPLSNSWGDSLKPLSHVTGITEFRLAYTDQKEPDPKDTGKWKNTWKCVSSSPPRGLAMNLQVGGGPNTQARKWYFLLGSTLP
jgi:prepilin-type N-terminal cleavage/methylation domain-containing protein